MAPVSTIRVTFEGMILLFVKDNTEYCDVGFLKDIAHHYSEVQITKIPRTGAAEILAHLHGVGLKDQLWLDVDKPNPRVRVYTASAVEPFPRDESTANSGDFRWAVNLEGHEVYDTPLKAGIALDRLKPRLRIYDGTFYSQTPLSSNKLTRKKHDEPNPVILGKVATQLRAEIHLDVGQVATFLNGPDVGDRIPLRAQQDVDYGIYVCNKRQHGHGDPSIDAENYHSVVATNIPPRRYIRFGRAGNRATPDAVCLPGWMGTSDL